MDISRVKLNLNRKVEYDGREYLLTGCIIRANDKGFYYQAEIKDLKANSSIAICRLEDITEKNRN